MIRPFVASVTVLAALGSIACAPQHGPTAEDAAISPPPAGPLQEAPSPRTVAPGEAAFRAGRPVALMDLLYRHRQTEIPPPGMPVVKLDLTNLMVGHDVLAEIASLPDLEILLLGGSDVDDSGVALVTGLPRLTHLGLRRTLITDEALSHVAKLTTLEKLYLSETPVSDAGIDHLRALRGLRQLALSKTRVSAVGVAGLSSLPMLERLWLDGTPTGDDELAELARGLKRLEVLSIAETGVTDRGVSDLVQLPGLVVLSLADTAITDECIPALLRIESLVRVNLGGTGISATGWSRLQAERPGLAVYLQDLGTEADPRLDES
jgi:hypothetical protein